MKDKTISAAKIVTFADMLRVVLFTAAAVASYYTTRHVSNKLLKQQ